MAWAFFSLTENRVVMSANSQARVDIPSNRLLSPMVYLQAAQKMFLDALFFRIK